MITILFSQLDLSNAQSTHSVCQIIAVDQSAYLLRHKTTSKRNAIAGDVMRFGDSIEVTKSNTVKLAFDQNEDNVLLIVGPAIVKIIRNNPMHLEMKTGKIFAILDDAARLGGFKVFSPNASTLARGTYFKVEANHSISFVYLYKGLLNVVGLDENGYDTESKVLVPAGTVRVDGNNRVPTYPQIMSQNAFDEINQVILSFEKKRELLDYDAMVNEFVKYQNKQIKLDRKAVEGEYRLINSTEENQAYGSSRSSQSKVDREKSQETNILHKKNVEKFDLRKFVTDSMVL